MKKAAGLVALSVLSLTSLVFISIRVNTPISNTSKTDTVVCHELSADYALVYGSSAPPMTPQVTTSAASVENLDLVVDGGPGPPLPPAPSAKAVSNLDLVVDGGPGPPLPPAPSTKAVSNLDLVVDGGPGPPLPPSQYIAKFV